MTIMGKVHKNTNKEFKLTGKRGRLIIRNLPFKCKENDVFKHFNKFGEIKDINLLRRPDKKLVGCGFVEFVSRQHADKAKAELNGQPFLGRQIYIETAKSQNVYDGTTKEQEGSENENFESQVKEEPLSSDDDVVSKKTKPNVKEDPLGSEHEDDSDEFTSKKANSFKQKNDRQKTNIKKARLIVRNLSFKTTEQKLKEHFGQFGEVLEVLLLRKPDKSLVGCGFVQFNKKFHAAKAIHHASGKPFLGRPIIVDWAIPKDKFRKFQEDSIKKEIKEEDEPNIVDLGGESNDKKQEIKLEDKSGSESDSGSESEDEGSEDDDGSENEADEEEEEKVVDSRKLRNDDVDEGKTVFVKNLPFSVTDQEFRERVEEFGPVFYALVCKDKLTEHSKGTGFVKYKTKEDAEKCLSSGTEFSLKGNTLDPHPALKRSEAQQKTDKSKEKKDRRNLYLMKEGMIIAGTPAAKGVSVPDMERRLQLEQWKSSRLRNLNMFVSPTRLVVHNLPPTLSDKTLRKLFLKHAGPKAVIKESRVMRDLKQSDSGGKSVSKGYGFIGFEKHEDALKALRTINNNPNIFTPTARPIVSFSVENKTVMNAKRKRLERSRQKNPLCKDYKPEETENQGPTKKGKFERSAQNGNEEQEPEFAGLSAKPGGAVKMRQKYKLKNQVQQHVQDVRKQKREIKLSRKARRTEHLKSKQIEKKVSKKNKHMEKDTAFSSMVDKYKSKILTQSIAKKKWYDE